MNTVKVENIKATLAFVYSGEFPFTTDFSLPNYLTDKHKQSYSDLDHLFIKTCGISILTYSQKLQVDFIKEQIVYTSHSFDSIARSAHFNSVVELSHFFKRHTGLSLSFYKELKAIRKDLSSRHS